jgi:hypothetical protein
MSCGRVTDTDVAVADMTNSSKKEKRERLLPKPGLSALPIPLVHTTSGEGKVEIQPTRTSFVIAGGITFPRSLEAERKVMCRPVIRFVAWYRVPDFLPVKVSSIRSTRTWTKLPLMRAW